MARWFFLAICMSIVARDAPAAEAVPRPDSPFDIEASSSAPLLQVCDSGGEGATSCETRWTVNVGGWGWPTGCGISCADGHYACCTNPTWYRNATCSCQPDPQEPVPWTPERPGL